AVAGVARSRVAQRPAPPASSATPSASPTSRGFTRPAMVPAGKTKQPWGRFHTPSPRRGIAAAPPPPPPALPAPPPPPPRGEGFGAPGRATANLLPLGEKVAERAIAKRGRMRGDYSLFSNSSSREAS